MLGLRATCVRWLLAALLVLLTSGFGSTAALAHATLVGSEPRDGAVVPAAPSELSLDFNEPVEAIALRLVDSHGVAVVLTDPHAAGNRLTVRLPLGLGQGTHALSWRVVSADGHPVGGSVLFAIGAPTLTPTLATGGSDLSVRTAIWLGRLSLLLASFIGVGGVVFAACIGTLLPSARVVITAALLLGLVATPVSVGLHGLDLSLRPLSGLLHPEIWKLGLFSPLGVTASIAFGTMLVGLVALRMADSRLRRSLALVALAGVGAAFLASGHVVTAEPRWISATALFAHIVCIAFWIGALVPLLTLILADKGDQALASFSRAIPIPAVGLVGSGAVLGVIQVGNWDALWSTAYGWVLSTKLAIVLGMFALAGVNRFVLTPALRSGSKKAAGRFVGTVSAELGLALILLATVAVWRFTPPPRSLTAVSTVYTHIHTDRGMADVSVIQGSEGRYRISIVVQTPEFRPLHAKEVALVLANPIAGVEPISRTAKPTEEDGIWLIEDLILPAQGRWAITVEVLVGDFERLELQGELALHSR